jgi:cob(I)alamin adenosyltransferase
MVVLNKIYTRTGDDGTTGLGSGERVKKYDVRVAAYGTVDEANAQIGVARLSTTDIPIVDAMLARIQNDLFDLGADLCVPDRGEKLTYEPLRIVAAQVKRLESEIDQLNDDLQPLRSFILPGGSAAAAHLHVARTVARRAERLVVELQQTKGEVVSPEAVQYINRLSDFLFVAARWVNDQGKADVLWVPGKNR